MPSNRIDLSGTARIEVIDGRRCLVTTSHEVTAAWEGCGNGMRTNHRTGDHFIPLTDVAPVYEYQPGEPWIRAMYQYSTHYLIYDCGIMPVAGGLTEWEYYMHRRAAAVCDGAEQFRALHAALKEVRNRVE